jgi:hypothetical protein
MLIFYMWWCETDRRETGLTLKGIMFKLCIILFFFVGNVMRETGPPFQPQNVIRHKALACPPTGWSSCNPPNTDAQMRNKGCLCSIWDSPCYSNDSEATTKGRRRYTWSYLYSPPLHTHTHTHTHTPTHTHTHTHCQINTPSPSNLR